MASKSLFVIKKNYYGPLDHQKPRQVIRNHSVDLSNVLQSVLSVHELPLFQGPVVLPLDTVQGRNCLCDQVLIKRTVFTHSGDQACGEWEPIATGLLAWNVTSDMESYYDTPDYDVNEMEVTLEGVASTRFMSIIYPCQVSHCQIHCPCSICSDLRKFRRQPCGQLGWRSQAALCHQACNRVQCKEHKILLGRLFNITIVTSRQQILFSCLSSEEKGQFSCPPGHNFNF